ncbi:MAG: bifunctional rhamnulose-1-phosphate aldolase/short-chain dehydrogenase [Calditrichales bacterium]|nr:MAG: bifunctional rhamnulose-1-phosphate aldolase/short-chain dehydrogenase [Calditrichales bacterium]
MNLVYLEDKWDQKLAASLDEGELLRYRSNLLGSDLRITNFGGGNTSSKIRETDPFTAETTDVLWVKGSGGDLGSIKRDGFSRLYMDKLLSLKKVYRGEAYEDEMVSYYPLCTFGPAGRPASIDTPLHGLLPFKHVDHMHPDWAIALAASANGQQQMTVFNQKFGRNLIWLPWQRPGFELGLMLEKAVRDNPQADGIILASHGLFTWGETQYECYCNTVEMIDQLGQFILPQIEKKGMAFLGGQAYSPRDDRKAIAEKIMPLVRGTVGSENKMIGHYVDLPDVLRFVNSSDAEKLAYQGTSCPDHFIRTKVRPLFVNWNPVSGDIDTLKTAFKTAMGTYAKDYQAYYDANKSPDSPKMRGSNPTVVLVPGIGMFSFGKNKKEARITGEFYLNAIHVMEGATAMDDGNMDSGVDSARVVNNYVALAPLEAFRIEYWALEEAKIQRQPKEKEMARKVAMVIGAGSGIGREFCFRMLSEGAHLILADINKAAVEKVDAELQARFGSELTSAITVDITNREQVQQAMQQAVNAFGGLDILINTAAIVVYPDKGDSFSDGAWDKTLQINVTANYIITEEFAKIVRAQESEGAVVLTSSANAVVSKKGSEPYDVSKAALNHLIREMAIRYAPDIRVNGVSPATVIEGSAMFPRERIMANLKKYDISFEESEETTVLTARLAEFYARRTLTKRPIRPIDVVEAAYHLAADKSDRTTGHIIPVDGGLNEAFLR